MNAILDCFNLDPSDVQQVVEVYANRNQQVPYFVISKNTNGKLHCRVNGAVVKNSNARKVYNSDIWN